VEPGGVAFYANRDRMNLDSRSWVLGKDYTAAPTCSTCHLSATADLPVTHDPGERISWTLRPAISKKWTYFLLWHHEGRRARHGASMMAPDYTQWHGFFEVANRFYNELLPEAEELLPGSTGFILAQDQHKWKKGIAREEREKTKKFYEERYGK